MLGECGARVRRVIPPPEGITDAVVTVFCSTGRREGAAEDDRLCPQLGQEVAVDDDDEILCLDCFFFFKFLATAMRRSNMIRVLLLASLS